MATEKKERERALLNEFTSTYFDFPDGKIEEFEEPDFLVSTSARVVGIELVDYVREQGKDGSVLRRDEELHQRIADEARAKFEARNPIPLMVHFIWYGHRHLSKADVKPLTDSIVKVVEQNVPQGLFHSVRIGKDRLSTSLHRLVSSVHVTRVRNKTQTLWSYVGSGWTEVTTGEVQSLIDLKNDKVEAYRQNCDYIWLLIVADGRYISSSVELQSDVKDHPFHSEFDCLIFWDYLNQRITLLNPG